MHIIYGHCAVGGAERTTEKTRALQQEPYSKQKLRPHAE